MTFHQGTVLNIHALFIQIYNIFADWTDCPCRSADLIVEVAHPSVGAEYGAEFLKAADFMVQSCLISTLI